MDAWLRHVRRCRRAHGVSDLASALEDGVEASAWRRRTRAEGWAAPYPGVRIAPWAGEALAPALCAVVAAHGCMAAVAGEAAAWWHGLGDAPRGSSAQVVIPHGHRARAVVRAQPEDREHRGWWHRCRRIRVTRCRWLEARHVETRGGLRVVRPAVAALQLAPGSPGRLRAYLVDARHKAGLDLDEVDALLDEVGPVAGRHVLRRQVTELASRAPESVFHDRVLEDLLQLGYAPRTEPIELSTPLGRPLVPDIPLERWKVAIELDGDAHHRDRRQRRRDRDRLAAYASTDWRVVIVDWQSWHEDRPAVLASIDAAIERQRRQGIGAAHRPPGSAR